ncbi:MAG: ATP phosphoribosyltransferase regulatory subunit [Anaerolineae bacterium]
MRDLIYKLQTHMTTYGYQVLDVPVIEDADLFLTKAGDQIAERLFTFQRSGRNLALRPEFTASAAHQYSQLLPPDVARWQFSGMVFEDDPNGHFQRMSAGAELFGLSGAMADAEVVAMAALGADLLNVQDWQIVIGHVGLTRHLLAQFALDVRTERFILHRRALLTEETREFAAQLEAYLPTENTLVDSELSSEQQAQHMLDVLLDASSYGGTMGGRTRHDIARRLLVKRQQASQREHVDAAVHFLREWGQIHDEVETAFTQIAAFVGDDSQAQHILEEWRALVGLLGAYGIPAERIRIQPDLVRTWDYYTGMVFEIRAKDGRLIAGGGRYDELTRLIGGQDNLPAVGFAYYLDQLAGVVDAPMQPLVMTYPLNAVETAIQWAQTLRQHGVAVALSAGDTGELTLIDGDMLYGARRYAPDDSAALVKEIHNAR